MLPIFRLTARRLVTSERCSRFRVQLRRLTQLRRLALLLLPRPVDPEARRAVRAVQFAAVNTPLALHGG